MIKKDEAPIEFTYVNDNDSEEETDDEELSSEIEIQGSPADDDEQEEDEIDDAEEENVEVELIETVFDEEQIDELIELLGELKETKTNVAFALDETTEVLIHHDEDPELEEEDE